MSDSPPVSLAKYVEQISDEFQSTFTVIDDNTLSNCLGMFKNDFDEVKRIIRKYIPKAKVTFIRQNQFPDEEVYDVYLVKV